MRRLAVLILILLLSLALPGCSAPAGPANAQASGLLNVVATTTIVGDVVSQVGGEHIRLTVLIPPGVDEHSYQPTPRDLAQVSDADLVFTNGAGLEPFLQKLTENAGRPDKVIALSDGISLLQGPVDPGGEADQPTGAAAGGDPHVWFDPNNVVTWVDNAQKALAQADPTGAAAYQTNADAYRKQLASLDSWIREQTSQVPVDRRKLVTDHLVFTYFAHRYDFEQVGAVVPGYSSAASPSAQALAKLEDEIRKLGVPAVFVGNTVNPAMAERVTADTNTRLVHILTGSLTTKDGPGPTYLDYMKYNVTQVVTGLK